MRPQNWDRLFYNLSFTHAVILYSEPKDPLIRYLSDIQDEFCLSYIPSLTGLSDDKIIQTIAKQLFSQPVGLGQSDLKFLLDQFDNNDICYVVAIQGLPSDSVINQLLQAMRYLAGRFNVIFEITPAQGDKFINDYPSQTVSLIGSGQAETNAKDNRAKSNNAKDKKTVTNTLAKTKSNKADEKTKSTQKKTGLYVGLGGILILFCGALFWLLNKAETKDQANAKAEIQPSSQAEQVDNPSIPQQNAGTAKQQIDAIENKAIIQENMDFVDKATAEKDMTAAEFFARQAKNQTSEKADKIQSDANGQSVTEAGDADDKTADNLVSGSNSDSELTQTDKPEQVQSEHSETNHQANGNQANEPELAESALNQDETQADSGYYDNLWFKAQKADAYVIQLTLVSSQKVLDEYLASLKTTEKLNIYMSEKYFGVTYGIYATQQQAIKAITQLPEELTREGAFAKSVAAIQKLISDKTEF
ncbi:hypothetical protein N7931_09345 [Catenovulum sp. 2E275]|uniref:hypothetical protein n=1 Tax=Catenovulum sp. 2E275 TaxID=2980497 RepID=UPI0021D0AE9F|nr:hypothetical protein [Catenovulum sp. 2E275]MCU4675838.1 hypothetical protein [Catenovulum sp. 2E275]